MGKFNVPSPFPKKLDVGLIEDLFLSISQAFNVLSSANFPQKGLDGSRVVADYSLPGNKLAIREYSRDLVLLATPYTTTATAYTAVGPYFAWDPAKYPGAKVYLEVTGKIANAAATASFQVKGSAALPEMLTIQSTSPSLVRVGPLTMPAAAENLWLEMKTSNASYAAYLYGARLIIQF